MFVTKCRDQHAHEAVRRVEKRNRFGTTLVMKPPRLRNPLPRVNFAFHECLLWMLITFRTRLQLGRRNGLRSLLRLRGDLHCLLVDGDLR